MNDRTSRRAARLALLYPRQWRRRFPDFVDALGAELADHRRGVRRDVVGAAAIEWLRVVGVLPAGPGDEARSGLGLLYASLLPFVGLSAGMWSQLRSATAGHGAAFPVLRALDLLLAVGTALALASFAAALPLVAVRARHRGAGAVLRGPLVRPVLAFGLAMTVLSAAGWAADRSGWYSPAAAALPAGGLGHALTLWARGVIAAITPAWVHPSLFARLPAGDLVATLVAPFAAVAASVALLRLLTHLPISPARRAHGAVAAATVGAMFLSVAATVRWLVDHPHPYGAALQGQLAAGHTPWAVAALLLALSVTAAIGARRVLRGGAPPSVPGQRRLLRGTWRPKHRQPARHPARQPAASDTLSPLTVDW